MEENRNQQGKRNEGSIGNQSSGQQNIGNSNQQNIGNRNPQSGQDWNNYQTRELSDNQEDLNENRSSSGQNSTIGNP